MRRAIIFLLSLILAFWGCQSFSSVIAEPRLFFNSVDIAGINIEGVNLIANVDVENPNGFSIPMPNIDWELFINNASFTQGSMKDNKSIGSRERVTLALPLAVSYDGLYRSVTSLIESYGSGSPEAAYNIAMGISFPIPFIENKVYKLDFSGALPLPQLPKLSLGQMRVSKMDLSGLELACGINVENPNLFPIPFPKINWDYGVNGVSVAKSSFAGAGNIAAGVTGVANIIVKASYADVIRAAGSIINTGGVRSNLLLDTSFPIPALDSVKNILNIPGTLPLFQ